MESSHSFCREHTFANVISKKLPYKKESIWGKYRNICNNWKSYHQHSQQSTGHRNIVIKYPANHEISIRYPKWKRTHFYLLNYIKTTWFYIDNIMSRELIKRRALFCWFASCLRWRGPLQWSAPPPLSSIHFLLYITSEMKTLNYPLFCPLWQKHAGLFKNNGNKLVLCCCEIDNYTFIRTLPLRVFPFLFWRYSTSNKIYWVPFGVLNCQFLE